MRDADLRRLLAEANPWWRAGSGQPRTAWIDRHRLLRDRERYDLGYRTDILADVAAAPVADSLILLTGPRRIGKSVALIDLAAVLRTRSVDTPVLDGGSGS